MIPSWTIEALPPELLASARAGRMPHRKLVANDPRLPCRCCLEEARPGSDALLVSVNPLDQAGVYAQPGPVFVCAACGRKPDAAEVPEVVTSRKVNLRAFDASETMIYRHSAIADGGAVSVALTTIFEYPAVEKVHIHTALHGCYLCRAVRAQ